MSPEELMDNSFVMCLSRFHGAVVAGWLFYPALEGMAVGLGVGVCYQLWITFSAPNREKLN
jgi:hypothetical protein